MASTELDTTLVDARGDSIPAVSMPGGVKLPGSAIVFRDNGGTDHPVSETDPLPVVGEVSIDSDQHAALLGQIAAVAAAVDALTDAVSGSITAGLIALDSDDFGVLGSAPGAAFGDLLGFAAAVAAWTEALANRDRVPYAGHDYAAAWPLGVSRADVVYVTLTGDVTSFINPTYGSVCPGVQVVHFLQDSDGGHVFASGSEDAGTATVVWVDGSAPDLSTDDANKGTSVRFTQFGSTSWFAEVLYRNGAPS